MPGLSVAELCRRKNAREKKRRDDHPIRHARLKKAEYQRNREKRLAAAKEYDRVHRLEKAEASRAWRKKHPRKAKALRTKSKHTYRARLANAIGSFTYREFRALCKQFGYRCLKCGKTESQLFKIRRVLAPDHVKPLSRHGDNTLDNIQPLCHAIKGGRGGCNNSKQAKEADYRGN